MMIKVDEDVMLSVLRGSLTFQQRLVIISEGHVNTLNKVLK